MTKMLEDVNYAIENLPDHKAQTNVPYRVTKWAALALKSQFCLFEGTFRKYHGLQIEGHDAEYYLKQSAEAAAELIENGPYKIWSSGKPASDYRDLFIAENANADEYILAIKYDNKIPMCHDAYGFPLYNSPRHARIHPQVYQHVSDERRHKIYRPCRMAGNDICRRNQKTATLA